MEETGTYLKKLVDIVTPETQVDEMYQRIHEVVGLLDKVVQRSWSFYAERSPSLSDYWEKKYLGGGAIGGVPHRLRRAQRSPHEVN
jgi:hypothetical protein